MTVARIFMALVAVRFWRERRAALRVMGTDFLQRDEAVAVCVHGVEDILLRRLLADEFAVAVLVGGFESRVERVVPGPTAGR